MWNSPRVLNRMADLLLALALLLVLYGGLRAIVRQPVFDLHEVRLLKTPGNLKAQDVELAVRRAVNGNFFTLRLPAARAAFEQLPWVRTAQLRRRWPDRLEVALEEHVPLARWGSGGLVNTHGEVFGAELAGELPVFVGPEGSAKEIAIQFEHFQRSLAALRFSPQRIEVTERRAWRIRLDSGLTLELGREQVEIRLARFIAAYGRTLGSIAHRIEHVDLRYSSGFAARIPDLAREAPPPATRGGAAQAGVKRT